MRTETGMRMICEAKAWTLEEVRMRMLLEKIKTGRKGKVCGKWVQWFCMYVIHLAPESADLASLLFAIS